MTGDDKDPATITAPARRAGWATFGLALCLAAAATPVWLTHEAAQRRRAAADRVLAQAAQAAAESAGRALDQLRAAANLAAAHLSAAAEASPEALAAALAPTTAAVPTTAPLVRIEVWGRAAAPLAAMGPETWRPLNAPAFCPAAAPPEPALVPDTTDLVALSPPWRGAEGRCQGTLRVIGPILTLDGVSSALRFKITTPEGVVLARQGAAEPFADERVARRAVQGWPLRVEAGADPAALSADSESADARAALLAALGLLAAALGGGVCAWAFARRPPDAAPEPALSPQNAAKIEKAGFLQAVLDALPFGVVARDAAGRVRLLNPAGAELLGASEAAVLGGAELLPPGASLTPREQEGGDEAAADPNAEKIMGLRRDDDPSQAPRWLAFSLRPAGDATVAALRDVGRVLASEQNHLREQALLAAMMGSSRLALEHMDQGVAVFDAQDRLTLWNSKAAEFSGVPETAIRVGASLAELTRAQALAGEFGPVDVDAETERRVKGFRPEQRRLTRRRRPNGQWIEYRQTVAPDGSLITLLTDVTDRITAEAAAREAYDRTVKVLNALPDAVITADDRGLIESFNAAAERMFGWALEDVVGRSVSVLMPARFRVGHEKVVADYQGPRHSHVMGRRRDLAGRRKDGQTFPIQAWVGQLRLPQLDAEGRPSEGRMIFCAVLRDVSDERRAEAELRMAKTHAEIANRAKSDFLLRMTHELRTPLNAVLGFSDLIEIEAEAKGLEEIADHAALVRGHGGELLEQIDSLLTMADLQSGAYDLHLEPIDLTVLAQQRLDLLKDVAAEARVALRLEIGGQPPLLNLDPQALGRVIDGLLSNALRFTPGGGGVELSVGVSESAEVLVACVDHGPGMSPEQMTAAFEPFTQGGHDVFCRPLDGAGVGLALARDLVELQGGALMLSATPGGGLTATIRLPLALASEPS